MTDSTTLTQGEIAFNEACEVLRAEGINVVAVLSRYSEKDAYFNSCIHVTEQPELGLTEDHLVMDAIREISTSWSEKAHR